MIVSYIDRHASYVHPCDPITITAEYTSQSVGQSVPLIIRDLVVVIITIAIRDLKAQLRKRIR